MTHKKTLITIATLLLMASGCDSWHQNEHDALMEACMDDAKGWLNNAEKERTYCKCVVKRVQTKYPNIKDALKNIDSVMLDPEVVACRNNALK